MADSFASGLARGIRNAQLMRQEKEAQEERNKMAKLQGQLVELQLKQAMQKQGVIDGLKADPVNASGVIPTPFLNAGQQPQTTDQKFQNLSVGDKLTLGIDPTKKSLAQQIAELQGLGIPGLGGQSQGSGMTPSFSFGPSGATVGLEPTRLIPREITNQDGSKTTVMVDPRTGGIGGQGFQSSPPQNELPLPANELLNVIDKETLGVPQGNITMKDVTGSDRFVRVTPKQRDKIDASKSAITTFETINDLVVPLFSGLNNGIGERSGKALELFINDFTQTNPDAIVYQNLNSELVTLIRAMGDVGAISDTQVREAVSVIPKLRPVPDSAKVAADKMRKLHRIITSPISTVLGEDSVPAFENIKDVNNLSDEELMKQLQQKLTEAVGGAK